MRKSALLALYLLLVIGMVAAALPAVAGAAAPGPGGQAYQAEAALPPSISGVVAPTAGPSGTIFNATVTGFSANEQVGVWWNAPDGTIIRSVNEETRSVDGNGRLIGATWSTTGDMPGIWSLVVHGITSGHTAVVYYEISSANTNVPAASDIPAPVNATIGPNTGVAGTLFKTSFSGFKPGEPVGYWFNSPEGVALEAVNQGVNWVNDDGVLDNVTGSSGMEPGLWSCVVQGIISGHQAIVYFVITPSSGPPAFIPDPIFPEPMAAHHTAGNGRGHNLQS
ncbi:MAG: hypothetical protein M1319_03990 [Chloroflexi bacterium]|nr:hypothetical protein [Chloroflexota bacterium]